MKGVILINTGSPDSFSPNDVGHYLSQFLMDERIIDLPIIQRTLLVKGIIIPFRKYKSAKAYQTIWTNEGSPLIVYSHKLARKVEQHLNMPCEVAMRYGSLTVEAAIDRLTTKQGNLSEILLVPLFPHYAMSSYESAMVHAQKILEARQLKYRTLPPFFKEDRYINALANLFERIDLSQYDWVQFSYHSIPLRHLRKSIGKVANEKRLDVDYEFQTKETARLVAEKIGMATQYGVSYQSAIGKSWLGPSTDDILKKLPSEGIKKLLIISPAFVADNLETIKDIDAEARDIFLKSGGETFKYIPCLNDRDDWATALAEMCREL